MNRDDEQRRTLRDIIAATIMERLDEYDGNRARAARSLGVTCKTIRNHIGKLRGEGYDIEPGRDGQPPKDDDD